MANKNHINGIQQFAAAPTGSKIDAPAFTPAQWAKLTTDGGAGYALLVEAMLPDDYSAERTRAVADAIRQRIERVQAGDTSDLVGDLVAQAAWLGALVAYCTRKATATDIQPSAADIWIRAALKAQTAAARTSAALAAIAAARIREVPAG